jgi:hypothetical protein
MSKKSAVMVANTLLDLMYREHFTIVSIDLENLKKWAGRKCGPKFIRKVILNLQTMRGILLMEDDIPSLLSELKWKDKNPVVIAMQQPHANRFIILDDLALLYELSLNKLVINSEHLRTNDGLELYLHRIEIAPKHLAGPTPQEDCVTFKQVSGSKTPRLRTPKVMPKIVQLDDSEDNEENEEENDEDE